MITDNSKSAQAAREAVFYLRSFMKDSKYPAAVAAHLNAIAYRLGLCDGIEAKAERQQKVYSAIVSAATNLISEMRHRSVPVDPLNPDHDDAFRALVDALTGVEGGKWK